MSLVLDEAVAIAKVQARSRGRAVLLSDVLRVDPDEDAFCLAPLKMAGEGRLWAVAFGRRFEEPSFFVAPDPRDRDQETNLVIDPFARALDSYFRECHEAERAPQVWVSSPSAVHFLEALSERRTSRNPSVALLGLRLQFLTDRYAYSGQQVLLSATDALAAHFVTGQSVMEDQHLGAFLAWVEPPPHVDAEQAAREAEELAAGVSTKVELDVEAAKLLTRLANLGKEEDSRTQLTTDIGNLLKPSALHIYGLIERAMTALDRQGLLHVPDVAGLRHTDWNSFDFYMGREFVPLRSSGDEAGRQLAARERALDEAAHIFTPHDRIDRTIATQEGEILEGVVAQIYYGPRAGSVHELDLETGQDVSKLRVGDAIRLDAPQRIVLQLLGQRPSDREGNRVLTFAVQAGKTSVSTYLGEEVSLMPSGSGYFDRYRRPARLPWILDRKGVIPNVGIGQVPDDPLRELDKLK